MWTFSINLIFFSNKIVFLNLSNSVKFLVSQTRKVNYSKVAKREVDIFQVDVIDSLFDTPQCFKKNACEEYAQM